MGTEKTDIAVVDPRIRVVRDKLADGRDVLYFDDPGTALPARRALDRRDLPERPATADLRHDPLTGEWITVATARQHRVLLPPADLDPLAPQTQSNPSELPDAYDVAVFENRSPSFGPALPDASADPPVAGPSAGMGLHARATSVGRCEVVSFSPSSTGSFASLGTTRARTVIEAWAQRTAELSALPGVVQVFPFENRGEAIGVTLHHPHGQIYAYPYVTPRTAKLQAAIREYGPSLMSDVLDAERNGPRVVLAGELWTAYVPFAARWPIEVHLTPHRNVPTLAATSLAERDELALMQPRLLAALDYLYASPTPYIAAWHQAPIAGGDHIRLNLQITSPRRGADRLKYLAGSEAAMEAWVGDVAPEAQAAMLRDAIAAADAARSATAR